MTTRPQATPAHTPGPWQVARDSVMTCINRIWDAQGVPVCCCDTDERPNAEIAANERLIAQAPALLAALEEIVACLEDEPSDATARLPMLRAAIAAARGGVK